MKPLLIISCPLDTFSGYGARSRDIVKVLIKSEKYDVKIFSQMWGNTPFGFLKADNEDHKQMLDRIITDPQLPRQPDVWIQITVPNEFQAIGKFNIGITAGIETTVCAPQWIEGCNRMNLTLVSSHHSKKVFEDSKFEQRDNNSGQVIKIIKLEKPIDILFEGVDVETYLPSSLGEKSLVSSTLENIKEEFCFLFVGHWLQGEIGQDRKDVGMLVKVFLETFKNKKHKPALILKTNGATYSILDKNEIEEKIQQIQQSVKGVLPEVYLLHGELTDLEMSELYNHPKVKSFVSLTKGEGYGRPLLEFSLSQKPIIASGWSGHLDFLHNEYNTLLSGKLTQLHPSAVVKDMLLAESSWFTVDYKKVSETLEDVYKNYKQYQEKAKRQAYYAKTNFSLEKMGERLISILDSKIPKFVPIVIPTFKKMGDLPKLKKV